MSSSRGFGDITQQLGELRVQGDNIQETLNQHIDNTQAWQRHTGERLHDMEHAVAVTAAGRVSTPISRSEPEVSLGEDPHEM